MGPPRPSASPARIRKLISSQSDPLLAKEIYLLSSSMPSSASVLPTLILKLARSSKFCQHSLSLLRHLPSSSVSPSLISSLALAFSSLSRPDLTLSLINRHLPNTIQSNPTKHFNRVLFSLASHPSSLPAALSLLKSAPSSNISVQAFNILITAFSLANKLSVAYSLFNDMFKLNLRPDADSYCILMQALCRKSQVSSALSLLDDMHNRGLVPDALTYTSLLNSLCRKKQLKEAYKMLCRMKVKGCNPDIVHYNTLIFGFCREGRPLDACKVLEDMSENGCLPNIVTYTTLVNGLSARSLLDAACGYLQEMVGKGHVPHYSVFHGLIKGLFGLGKVEEACKVLDTMLHLGVPPHVDTWELAVPGICEDDKEKFVNDLHQMFNGMLFSGRTKIV